MVKFWLKLGTNYASMEKRENSVDEQMNKIKRGDCMRQVRQNVFETNSSSTHSICVTKNNILDNKVDEIYFRLDEFGWEYSILSTVKGYIGFTYEERVGLEIIPKLLEQMELVSGLPEKLSEYLSKVIYL